ncbi:hypothetical protein BDY24DRAFT_370377 [Mrakia frigida]|uniref:SDR family NAD(P)-dependent oxidoreductase n=1 Tax=Mrakia frigida TaxID=29902 RepID=UPI003FCBFDE9
MSAVFFKDQSAPSFIFFSQTTTNSAQADMSLSRFSVANLFSVQNKVVVLTGGGSGLGRDMTLALAQNGATVFIVGRRKSNLDEVAKSAAGLEGRVIPVQGDVTSKLSIEEIYHKVETEVGKVDALINNAGLQKNLPTAAGDATDPVKVQESLWSAECQVHASPHEIRGITGRHQLCLSRFLDRRRASKAGALHMSRVLAARLVPAGIRSVAILPNIFPSEMSGGSLEAIKDQPWARAHLHVTPSHRFGTAEDVGGTVIWLISRAGEYVNGTSISLDGGGMMTSSALEYIPKDA